MTRLSGRGFRGSACLSSWNDCSAGSSPGSSAAASCHMARSQARHPRRPRTSMLLKPTAVSRAARSTRRRPPGSRSSPRPRGSQQVSTARPPGPRTRGSSQQAASGCWENWIASTHSTASTEPSPRPVAARFPRRKSRRGAQPPCVLAGLAHRLGREVHPHQPGPGAGGDLQAVAPAAAGHVQHGVAGRQAQRFGDRGDRRPAEQAGGQQVRRQAQMAPLDLVLDRRPAHGGVPAAEGHG